MSRFSTHRKIQEENGLRHYRNVRRAVWSCATVCPVEAICPGIIRKDYADRSDGLYFVTLGGRMSGRLIVESGIWIRLGQDQCDLAAQLSRTQGHSPRQDRVPRVYEHAKRNRFTDLPRPPAAQLTRFSGRGTRLRTGRFLMPHLDLI